MGGFFGFVWGVIKRSHPPRVSQLWVRHHWAFIFTVRRQGPDGRKVFTMNSTATCSTGRGMGSVRLYLAHDLSYDENKQPYRIGHLPGQKGQRFPPYTRTEVSSMLLVHHRKFVEETSSEAHRTQGH